jgi:hypothetical protein
LCKVRMPDGGIKFAHPIAVNGKVYACCATARPDHTSAHLCIFGPQSGDKTMADGQNH